MWLLALALPGVLVGAVLRPKGTGAVWEERREGKGSGFRMAGVSVEERRSLVALEEGVPARCELPIEFMEELEVDLTC